MEKAAFAFAQAHGMRLCVMLPTLMLGPAVLPQHAQSGFLAQLRRMAAGEPGRHQQVPNDSSSMIHLDDMAALFLAAYENPDAHGRYFSVYDSWPWQDIYDVLAGLLPDTPMPAPLTEAKQEPTGFDFTRRDSLGIKLRPIPEILADTVAWCRANPGG